MKTGKRGKTVFVRYTSHVRYDGIVRRLGYRPKSYYVFGSGTNWLELREVDFPKIAGIAKLCKPHPDMRPTWSTGVPDSSWRAKYPRFEDLYPEE